MTVNNQDAERIFYYDLPPEQRSHWTSRLLSQSVGVFKSVQTYAAWRHIPSTYVIGEADRSTFAPEAVDLIISGARQTKPSAFDVVERCDGGHCLMISRPQFLAGVLRRAAGEMA